jgi:hypothetical protein
MAAERHAAKRAIGFMIFLFRYLIHANSQRSKSTISPSGTRSFSRISRARLCLAGHKKTRREKSGGLFVIVLSGFDFTGDTLPRRHACTSLKNASRYSATMAPMGQAATQAPQSMQSSGSIL